MFFKRKREEREEVFIGYIDRIGILDLQGVEEYLREERVREVYLVVRMVPNERVLSYLEGRPELRDKVRIVRSDDLKGEVKRIKKENAQFRVRVQDMREFGKRAMSRDPF